MRALGAVAALALALPPGAPIVRIAETKYDVDEAVVFDDQRALPSLLADFRELDVDWPSLGFVGCASADCAAAGLLAELRRRRVTIADERVDLEDLEDIGFVDVEYEVGGWHLGYVVSYPDQWLIVYARKPGPATDSEQREIGIVRN
ncbi:hypothetical protein JL721_4863 [Aureococcus anophagefferens]|nr:hypothetical protein JL721_4863 [Aureococcus anophagefferens]